MLEDAESLRDQADEINPIEYQQRFRNALFDFCSAYLHKHKKLKTSNKIYFDNLNKIMNLIGNTKLSTTLIRGQCVVLVNEMINTRSGFARFIFGEDELSVGLKNIFTQYNGDIISGCDKQLLSTENINLKKKVVILIEENRKLKEDNVALQEENQRLKEKLAYPKIAKGFSETTRQTLFKNKMESQLSPKLVTITNVDMNRYRNQQIIKDVDAEEARLNREDTDGAAYVEEKFQTPKTQIPQLEAKIQFLEEQNKLLAKDNFDIKAVLKNYQLQEQKSAIPGYRIPA